MAAPFQYALSLKQPWAALVVHGLKSIEVRRWATVRRGPILIHAARIPDTREPAWRHVPEALQAATQQMGGIIGAVELTECRTYRFLDEFVRDQPLHLNYPGWFEPPQLYGLVFEKPQVLPFRAFPGWFRFFKVEEQA